MGSACFTQGVQLEYLESFQEGYSVGGIGKGVFRLESPGNTDRDIKGVQQDIVKGHTRRSPAGTVGNFKGVL